MFLENQRCYSLVRKSSETDVNNNENTSIFFCKGKGLTASGEYTEEGFVVFKGSEMATGTSASIHNYLITKREALVKDQIVIENEKAYVFQKDHLFSSPSQAAGVVLGRNANGWFEWKNKDGETMDFIKRGNRA